jgi:hypothetical protein
MNDNVPGKAALWGGRVMSGLALLPFLLGGIFSLVSKDPSMAEGFVKFGWDPSFQTPIILLELVCALLYLIPNTAMLGAILLTGYLGGAIATHLRIQEMNVALQVILGVMIWGGLFLRYPVIRRLIPIFKP